MISKKSSGAISNREIKRHVRGEKPTITPHKRYCGITSKGRSQNVLLKRYVCLTADVKVRIPQYPPSAYQTFLYEKIKELQNAGLAYRKIAHWFNDKGYEIPRGHQFKKCNLVKLLLQTEIFSFKIQYNVLK